MKSVFIIFATCLTIIGCNDSAQKTSEVNMAGKYEFYMSGMKYVVYTRGDALCITNVTKDSLEVEFLKSKLNK